jgi:hypothetical protein
LRVNEGEEKDKSKREPEKLSTFRVWIIFHKRQLTSNPTLPVPSMVAKEKAPPYIGMKGT